MQLILCLDPPLLYEKKGTRTREFKCGYWKEYFIYIRYFVKILCAVFWTFFWNSDCLLVFNTYCIAIFLWPSSNSCFLASKWYPVRKLSMISTIQRVSETIWKLMNELSSKKAMSNGNIIIFNTNIVIMSKSQYCLKNRRKNLRKLFEYIRTTLACSEY